MRNCIVCRRDDIETIDEKIRDGIYYKDIAKEHNIAFSTVKDHGVYCLNIVRRPRNYVASHRKRGQPAPPRGGIGTPKRLVYNGDLDDSERFAKIKAEVDKFQN